MKSVSLTAYPRSKTRRVGAKHQNPAEQSRVRAQDRVRLIKMDAVRPVPADDAAAADEVKS